MKIAVVILNWNGRALLEQFLPSVVSYSPEAAIYVVDNASEDNSVSYVQTHFPGINILRNTENLGYVGGYNQSLRHIEADVYCLLNSDVEVTPHWLAPITKRFQEDSALGVLQPKMKDQRHRHLFEYAGAAGGFIDSMGYPYCRGRLFQHIEEDRAQYNDIMDIQWASGACFFVRSDVFWELGGFDEDYFAHQEEVDFCWRARNRRHKVQYLGHSEVYHIGGATLSNMDPKKTFLNFRNSLYTLTKNLPKNRLLPVLLSRLLLDGFAVLYFLFNLKLVHVVAVFWSHMSFYKHLRRILRKRDDVKKSTDYYRGGSIVWQYFVKGKRKWGEIH